ncbi:MAG: M20/M25/M40 family metallo-hydrolase [Ruminococcus sp.]|nr:M20/M25/M40 family metallo-hydrolase [Ruminococcus sp.]
MKDKKALLDRLTTLCTATGVSGAEENIADVCAELFSAYGEVGKTPLGSVFCKVGRFDPAKKTLMLNAHIDEIGLIVTHITDDGFLKVSKCGGTDTRVLPASKVTIYGREKLYGIITSVPPHLQSDSSKAASLDDLYVDTGLSGERAKALISRGDRVLIENEPLAMGSLVTSKALDDRACVLTILEALDMLSGKENKYNIEVLLSTGEEVGSHGARTGAFTSEADFALILDVTFGRVHGESGDEYFTVGGGAAIGISPVLDRRLSGNLIETAKAASIPYQIEVMGGRTGTDADAVAVSGSGIPSCTVSVPIRYMHTPVEAVSPDDITNTAALVAEFCERGLF